MDPDPEIALPDMVAPVLPVATLGELLVPLALAIARPIGLIAVFPLFTRAQLGGLIRGGVAIVVVLPLVPGIVDAYDAGRETMRAIPIVYTLKEVLVGALLGVLLGLPFWAVQAVGEVVDTQRGVTNSDMEDAATGSQMAVTGLFLGFASVALFVAADGLLAMSEVLYDSYEVWPVMRLGMSFNADGLGLLASMIDYIFRYALALGGPLLVMLLLTDVSLAFLSRSAPQIVTMDVSPTIKNLVFTLFLTVYGLFFTQYIADELAAVRDVPDLLRLVLDGPSVLSGDGG